MRKYILLIAAVALACTNIEEQGIPAQDSVIVREASKGPQIIGADVPEEKLVPGKLIVKVSEEYAQTLESLADENGIISTAATKSEGIGNITSMKRLFPYAGRFEERTRKEGLHLWYVAEYDENMPATKAAGSFLDMDGITLIEYQVKTTIVGGSKAASYCSIPASPSAKQPFNDPGLSDQWHYINDGSLSNSRLGCDIGVSKAWDYVVGNPDVIVSVVDAGVDYTHEDLADNMWHNPEMSGNKQYGYNFTKDSYVITAAEHGTHVAGTIAAVNNNGKGVCGIAGGDAKAGKPGVKIMSCQIFGNTDKDNADPDPAIKWGADHGAVICQNSWNYDGISYVPSSTKAAIDYFIKYAGVDEYGNQTGPIKGGLVFFSAGNENSNYGSPCSYASVVAVTAVGADYERAYYSNYGSWTDIAAPGGDDTKGRAILSTLPGNSYGYFQGTSMACPHVSGAAALLVSHFGKEGVTADMIKQRLLENTLDISAYNNKKIGAGLVNVGKALFDNLPQGVAPETITYFTASPRSNFIDIEITVPRDEDDGSPSYLLVNISKYPSRDSLVIYQFSMEGKKAGETLKCTVSGLDFDTEYYVAVAAADISMNTSELSEEKIVRTQVNNPPVIEFADPAEGLVFRYNQIGFINFSLTDPDGHDVSARLDNLPIAASVEQVTQGYRIRINANYHTPGQYEGTLYSEDEFGASSSASVKYTILENRPPKVTEQFENVVFNSLSDKGLNYTLNQFFADDDEEILRYSASLSEKRAKVSCQDGHLTINPTDYGYADLVVTASDNRNASVSQTIRILVRDGRSDLDIYPNPVKTQVNIRTAASESVDLKITSPTGAVVFSGVREIDPFNPLQLDLSKISAGTYTVTAVLNGKEIKQTFSKL